MSCDKAFQDPCHSEKREQKYVQKHIRICTHGVKTGLGYGHHRPVDTQSPLISQSQVRPSQWLAGAGAQTQPVPCSVRTLKPCQWGRVSRPATGEFPGPKWLQGQLTVASYAPLTAGPNSPLSQREGPAFIPEELVPENGLFQPKPILAPKTPKFTPRLDPPEVGTRQPTICPSRTNSLEPSPNLVPSEVPASGHHGFIKWGNDAKITKIGVFTTRDSPGQRKAIVAQGRRQDLGPISECTT